MQLFVFQMKLNGKSHMIWDVGGQDKLRPLWRSYTRCTDGIIFVVDSSKQERLEEAKLELSKIYKSCHVRSSGTIPLLVLANKQDLPNALDANRVEQMLSLKDLGTKGTSWQVQATCAVTGEGLEEGIGKLHEMISNKKRFNGKLHLGSSSSNVAKPQKSSRKVQRSHSHHYWAWPLQKNQNKILPRFIDIDRSQTSCTWGQRIGCNLIVN